MNATIERISPAMATTDLCRVTPLRQLPDELLRRLFFPPNHTVFIKDETANESLSAKGRVAKQLINTAMKDGRASSGTEVVLPSSGSTAIAMAYETQRLGLRLTVFVPNTTPDKKLAALARFENTTVVRINGSSEDARLAADAYCEAMRSATRQIWLADQYGDPAAVLAHALTTAPEIVLQTQGKVTHVVAGIGTGSTSTGLALSLRRLGIDVVGVEPTSSSHTLVGLKYLPGVPPELVPRNAQTELLSSIEFVADEEARAAMWMLVNDGFLFGRSTGAVVAGARRVACRERRNSVFVLIGHDSSSLYL